MGIFKQYRIHQPHNTWIFNSIKKNDTELLLKVLLALCKTFFKIQISGQNLLTFYTFQYGRLFMETFMKVGMPLLDQLLRVHKVSAQISVSYSYVVQLLDQLPKILRFR